MNEKKQEVSAMSAKERYLYIRSVMVRSGVTNAAISREADVSREYVFMVMSSQRKGYRVRQLIAQRCSKPIEDLWPDTPEEYRTAA